MSNNDSERFNSAAASPVALGHAQNPDAFCLICNEHPCKLITPAPAPSAAIQDEAMSDAGVARLVSALGHACGCTDHDPNVCLEGEVDEGSRYCHCDCHVTATTPPSTQARAAAGGEICKSHGLAVLVTHVNDGEPCLDYLSTEPAPTTKEGAG